MTRLPLLILLGLSLACAKKQNEFTVAHRYPLTGKIVALNPKDQTASVAAAAIPNYMDAMTMDYPIASKSEFDKLHVGESIKATLNVSAGNDEYNVTNIQNEDAGQTHP